MVYQCTELCIVRRNSFYFIYDIANVRHFRERDMVIERLANVAAVKGVDFVMFKSKSLDFNRLITAGTSPYLTYSWDIPVHPNHPVPKICPCYCLPSIMKIIIVID